ncbi:hypothetical protein E05_08110 [Plautia stali symbiont]|nr:hypothetical protein E05_08110 [Plautia stali symbiont]
MLVVIRNARIVNINRHALYADIAAPASLADAQHAVRLQLFQRCGQHLAAAGEYHR